MKFGEWTKASDQLPPIPVNEYSGDKYIATVINEQVVAVNYVKRTIRKKEIIRWEWNGQICPWDIIAYMPFPKPYKE
jgi:hypothetical protein